MLDFNMFRDIAVMVRFVFAQVTVIPLPLVVVSTLNMRVQYGCLNSFIVAMVTFEELFRIMSSHVRAHSDFLHGLLKRVLQLGVLGNLR